MTARAAGADEADRVELFLDHGQGSIPGGQLAGDGDECRE
jgi:hypothetical protein